MKEAWELYSGTALEHDRYAALQIDRYRNYVPIARVYRLNKPPTLGAHLTDSVQLLAIGGVAQQNTNTSYQLIILYPK